MPFIDTKTTKKISPEDMNSLTEKFGKAIELIPGKSERWLMLNFSDGCRMAFAGSFDDCAMLEVKLFGAADPCAYDALTAELCKTVSDTLGIPSDRIYVKYEEISAWGFAGSNF